MAGGSVGRSLHAEPWKSAGIGSSTVYCSIHAYSVHTYISINVDAYICIYVYMYIRIYV